MKRRDFLAGGLAVAAAGVARPKTAAELPFASALEAAGAIRRGEVSSVELTTHLLGRIDRLNPKLNAIVTLDRERALARAREADQARSRGQSWGPFHGVPVTIKDAFEVAGLRSTGGAPFLKDHVPQQDAAVAERLRRAGGVILGKTNVPVLSMDWQSYNPVFGQTNNPWDAARTPGGSSGGEAAALAAGLSYLSVGSDIGGSIRIPAHFCGVYGHKPSLNVVPLRGHIPPPPAQRVPEPPPDLPVAGPLARSAADLKAALEVLGGPDGDDAKAYRWSLPAARRARVADFRIGFVLDDPLCPVSADQGGALARVVEALRKAGAKVEPGWPAGVDPGAQFNTYLYVLMAAVGGFFGEERARQMQRRTAREGGSEAARKAAALGASPADLPRASAARFTARAAWQDYFRTHDAFLLPTAIVPAFPHDHAEPSENRTLATSQGPRPYLDMLFWISFATFAGLPATTAPAGFTPGGLPVGVQIVGPYLEDATPIDLAARLADLIGGFRPPKGF